MDINLIKNSTLPLILEYDDKYDKTDISELLQFCENGDPAAQYELAARYRLGIDGVEKDAKREVELYERILEKQKNALAARYMASGYLDGVFGAEQKTLAVDWFKLASDWGSGDATECLGLLYFDGEIVEQDNELAIELFKKAIGQGNKHAFLNLGDSYRIKEDYSRAKYYFEKAIEEAKVYYAYVLLAQLYENGLGVEKDDTKAYSFYNLAYKHDIKEDASYYMGRMHFDGRGVEEDNAKAYQFFEEALSYGVEESNYFLGILNYLSDNEHPVVEKNANVALRYLEDVPEHMRGIARERQGFICVKEGRKEEAIAYYEKAAALGNKTAVQMLTKLNPTPEDKRREFMNYLLHANIDELLKCYNEGVKEATFLIGKAYHEGKNGAPVDYVQAMRFYQKTIEQGEIGVEHAYFELASMYLEGQGVAKNGATAVSYFETAAGMGSPYACSMLGEIYRHGQNVPKDIEKAVFWFQKGAVLGDVNSDLCLAELYLQGKIENKQSVEKAIEHLKKVLEKKPTNPSACWYMAVFLCNGVLEDGRVILNEDKKQAIKYCQIAAEGGRLEAYDKLGEIYADPSSIYHDYEAAIKYYMEGANKGRVWSWAHVAALHLLPEFRGEQLYDPLKGIQAAKEFLENGDGSRGLKEYLMGMMVNYYASRGGKDEYCRQEYLYLFNHLGTMGLAYTTEENQNRLISVIDEICERLIAFHLGDAFHGWEKVMDMFGQLERIIDRNSYIKKCAQNILLKNYIDMAQYHLRNQELEMAKQCYEKAAWRGSCEAEAQLRRFSTTLFGKLKYD